MESDNMTLTEGYTGDHDTHRGIYIWIIVDKHM